MATGDFDQNTWYIMMPTTQTDWSLLSDGSVGAYLGPPTNSSDPSIQWQLYPLANPAGTYLLRCRTQNSGFLSTMSDSNQSDWPPACAEDSINCTTTLYMRTGADQSSIWTLTPWGNVAYDSYYLTNAANGTGYYVDEQPNLAPLYMNSNTTAGRPGQQWKFSPNGTIDDPAFSTVDPSLLPASATASTSSTATPSSTSTGSTTGATTPPPTSSPTSTSHSSGGLSTGAEAGIGGGIGVAAVLGLAILIWIIIFRRRRGRKARKQSRVELEGDVYHPGPPPSDIAHSEMIRSGMTSPAPPMSANGVEEIKPYQYSYAPLHELPAEPVGSELYVGRPGATVNSRHELP